MQQSLATLLVLVLHVCTVLSTVTEHTEHHHHNDGKCEEVKILKIGLIIKKDACDIGEVCMKMTSTSGFDVGG